MTNNIESAAELRARIPADLRQSLRFVPTVSLRQWMIPFARRINPLFVPRGSRDGVTIRESTANGVRIRIYAPASSEPKGGMLWIHGGGLIVGSPRESDARVSKMVRELGITVVAPYYRLAPEHPFPAGLDDCYKCWQWLRQEPEQLRITDVSMGVAGESAGGGLAASLAQRLSDEGEARLAYQCLIYPMLDDRTAARVELDQTRHPIWTNRSNRTGWECYLQAPAGSQDTPPYAVPARVRNANNLPPTWIGVGDADLFYDEDNAYATTLQEAGVTCQIDNVSGAFHGFDVLGGDTLLAQDFHQRYCEFIRPFLSS